MNFLVSISKCTFFGSLFLRVYVRPIVFNPQFSRFSFHLKPINLARSINVAFANGHEDELDLKHYKLQELSVEGCNYLGNLRNTPSSSVAVTGCLNKPEDQMEITLISGHNRHKMFAVDVAGNAFRLSSPFEEGGRSKSIQLMIFIFGNLYV